MLEEREIARHCDSRVLRRARNIARTRDAVYARSCAYEPASASRVELHSQVVAQDSRSSYEVTAHADLDAKTTGAYDCTCADSLRQSGMCKHVVAMLLSFVEHPETFIGYERERKVQSSEGMVQALRFYRLESQAAAVTSNETLGFLGSINIGITFVRRRDGWSARFRIGDKYAGYAIDDLDAFVSAMQTGAYRSYGSKLGFEHRLEAIAPASRPVVAFITRSLAIRDQLERRGGGQLSLKGQLRGEVPLSVPELVELLDLGSDLDLSVDDVTSVSHRARRTRVIDGDPPVRILFEDDGDEGFSFTREGVLDLFSHGGCLYAWLDGIFYHCTDGFASCSDFLSAIYGDPREEQFLSESDAAEFCSGVLPQVDDYIEVVVPDRMAALKPAPCNVEIYLDYLRGACTCRARAVYGADSYTLLDFEAPGSAVVRDRAHEIHVAAVLKRYFPASTDSFGKQKEEMRISNDADIATLLFKGLPELRSCSSVLTTPAFDALTSKRTVQPKIGLSIESGLIDLHVSSDDLSRTELAQVLQSYHLRRQYHRLPDGSFIDLADAGLEDADTLLNSMELDPAQIAEGDFLLQPYRAFELDALVAEESKQASFIHMLRTLESAKQVAHELPPQLAKVMRPYQKEGFAWLNALADNKLGGILADEMGLGKSLQLIAYLDAARDASGALALVVCPASLVYNWQAEFSKFSPDMETLVIAGGKEERAALLSRLASGRVAPDVVITSYDLLKRDIDAYDPIEFSCVALDEAQYIKNAGTLASKTAKSLHAQVRFALTGTPVENRLSELWSIFDFLMPGLLGSYRAFRERFEQPIMNGDAQRMDRLRELAGRFVLRRFKADVLDDLPAKQESIVYAQMADDQRKLYQAHEQALRESLQGKGGAVEGMRMEILAELMRLRELACDPHLVYTDYDGSAAKLDAIMELVDTARDSGKKILVFSQFTRFLDRIASRLTASKVDFHIITGATPKRRRVELVDMFNADETPVFLVSLKAGGTGLNLTGASVVIHADPWWNLAAENQATDRSHRIGQTKDVMVYKVIASKTIEERVISLQEAKSELADKVIGQSEGTPSAALSVEELISLLEQA